MALLTNVATADSCIVFTTFIPKATTIYARRWVLGKALCFINAVIPSIGGLCEMITLAFLCSYKLFKLMFPFKGDLSLRQAVGVICVMWIWSCIPAAHSILTNGFAYFDPNSFDCFMSTYSVSYWFMDIPQLLLNVVYLVNSYWHKHVYRRTKIIECLWWWVWWYRQCYLFSSAVNCSMLWISIKNRYGQLMMHV